VSQVVLGCDPGFTGALAAIDGDDIEIHDAPILTVGTKRFMDLLAMKALLLKWRDRDVRFFIEKVHSFPGSSARSMFSFGQGYGEWRGEVVALGFSLTEVEPARWKGALMDGLGREKDAARYRAALLFPTVAHLFARKNDDGRAEALLIAEYGRRTLK
jgi:hypothetical protein